MTVPRFVLIGCVILAIADGAWLEAVGLAGFLAVLFVAFPTGIGRWTPWPQR